MLRKWMCFVWALAMVWAAAGQAEAAERRGTVQIVPQWCGIPVTGGTIMLQYAGQITKEGYYLTDGLANWSISEEELEAGEGISWLLEKQTGKIMIQEVGPETGARFGDLEKGIYLVRQQEAGEGYRCFAPFFLKVPEGESWDVYRAPDVLRCGESPRTGDYPAPIIGAMGIGLSVACLMVLVDKYHR